MSAAYRLRRWRLGGVRTRIVATTAALTLVGMTALVGLVWLVLERTVDTNVRSLLADRADSVSAGVQVSGDTLAVADLDRSPSGAVSWVFDASGRQVLGPTGSSLDRLAASYRGVTDATVTEADDGSWMLRAQPLDEAPGVVVVAAPLLPYQSTLQTALEVSIGLGVLVVGAVTGLTAWSVGRALRPVGMMARSAAAWSEQDLDRRFDLGPPHDEITELGRVLDGLLARVSHAILAEQRLTAELAHELRTPLTVVRAEAEVALVDPAASAEDRERFERIVAATDRLTSVIDTLLTVARAPVVTGKTVRVADVLAAATAPAAIGAPSAVIAVDHVPDLRIAAPREVALRALGPLVDNAVRYAKVRVRLGAKADGAMVAIYVEDDGPGVPDEDREAVFEPGHLSTDSDGAGLGLPLARRVARASGGDVRRDDAHPARFVLTLPGEP